jgi:hypothetical protein
MKTQILVYHASNGPEVSLEGAVLVDAIQAIVPRAEDKAAIYMTERRMLVAHEPAAVLLIRWFEAIARQEKP